MFDNITDHVDEISDHVRSYVKSTIEYHKLDFFKKGVKSVVSLARVIIILGILLLLLVFVSTGSAIWIGEELGSTYLGFFIVGAFYLILLLFMLIFGRRILQRLIITSASKNFFND